jgi:uncharacterized membrane protein
MNTLLALYVIFGLLMAGLAIPLLLDKIPPNPWYGFRVPSTLADERLWYKVNRYAARWLLLAGVLTVAGAIFFYSVPGLTVDRYAWLCLAAFLVGFIPLIVFSWRYLQRAKAGKG